MLNILLPFSKSGVYVSSSAAGTVAEIVTVQNTTIPTIAPTVAMTALLALLHLSSYAAMGRTNALAFCARTRLATCHLRRRAKEKRWSNCGHCVAHSSTWIEFAHVLAPGRPMRRPRGRLAHRAVYSRAVKFSLFRSRARADQVQRQVFSFSKA
jgi:hypothetical protein